MFRTLAGSTIMLLTLAWGGSLFLGRCDLDENGEAIEETGDGVNCRKQVKAMQQLVVSTVIQNLIIFHNLDFKCRLRRHCPTHLWHCLA